MNSGQFQLHTNLLSLSKQIRRSIGRVHIKIWEFSGEEESVSKSKEQTKGTVLLERTGEGLFQERNG